MVPVTTGDEGNDSEHEICLLPAGPFGSVAPHQRHARLGRDTAIAILALGNDVGQSHRTILWDVSRISQPEVEVTLGGTSASW